LASDPQAMGGEIDTLETAAKLMEEAADEIERRPTEADAICSS
jgi:hypothetical protein